MRGSEFNQKKFLKNGEIDGTLNAFQGEKADVYSLGVILFTMFFSQLPF
jgi:serine/threonine protein kinase